MKILLASEYYLPHWTGIVKACAGLSENLTSQGHIVTILTTLFSPELKRKENFGNIKVIRSTPLFRLSRAYYSVSILWDFFKLCKKNDIVIINSPNSNILFFSIITKLHRKKLYIFHQGDLMLPRQTGNIIINSIIEKIFDLMTIISFFLSDKISTYTADYAQNSRVMRYFLNKFFSYIPSLSLSLPDVGSPIYKELTRLKKSHTIIGFAGRFVEEKGFDILLKSIVYVTEKIPDSLFVFAGQTDIDYEPFFDKNKELLDRNKSCLKFLGLLNDADLAAFYQSLDVFVVSSRSDCFPLAQIEAALSGVPIVATNIPGARVLVLKTDFGVMVESENPLSLGQGIVSLIENQEIIMKNKSHILPFLKLYENFKID